MATAYSMNKQEAMQDKKIRSPASIISAMCANIPSTRIQIMGCVALCALSDQNPRNDTLITNTSGIPVILSAMAMHTNEANLQKSACAVLRKISSHNGNNRDVIRQEKGITQIVIAMHQHRRSADVLEEACAALNNLSINNDVNKNEILNAGGISAVITAMRENLGSVSMQEKACCVLCNLSFGDDARKRLNAIQNEGGVKVIIQTMENHVNAVEVQRMACGALRYLSKDSSKSRDDICSADGISAIVAAMVSNPNEVAVQEVSCDTLKILLKPENPNLVRHVIEEAGNTFRNKRGKQALSLTSRLERSGDSGSEGIAKSQYSSNRAKHFISMLNRHSKANKRKGQSRRNSISTVTEGTNPDGTRVQYIVTTSFGKNGSMQTTTRTESISSEVETPLNDDLKIGGIDGAPFASHMVSMGSADHETKENSSLLVPVVAPPGKLGIFLESRKDGRQGTIVIKVKEESHLFGKIFPGDRIVAVDNENVTHLSVAEATAVISRRSDRHRQLTIATTVDKKVAASYSEKKYRPLKKAPHNDIAHKRSEKIVPPNNTKPEKSKTPEELLESAITYLENYQQRMHNTNTTKIKISDFSSHPRRASMPR